MGVQKVINAAKNSKPVSTIIRQLMQTQQSKLAPHRDRSVAAGPSSQAGGQPPLTDAHQHRPGQHRHREQDQGNRSCTQAMQRGPADDILALNAAPANAPTAQPIAPARPTDLQPAPSNNTAPSLVSTSTLTVEPCQPTIDAQAAASVAQDPARRQQVLRQALLRNSIDCSLCTGT